jgi:hypothetical protein
MSWSVTVWVKARSVRSEFRNFRLLKTAVKFLDVTAKIPKRNGKYGIK